MQERNSVVEHVDNMVVMVKDLAVVWIFILENVQVETILNIFLVSLNLRGNLVNT
jgi:hypothetical protein